MANIYCICSTLTQGNPVAIHVSQFLTLVLHMFACVSSTVHIFSQRRTYAPRVLQCALHTFHKRKCVCFIRAWCANYICFTFICVDMCCMRGHLGYVYVPLDSAEISFESSVFLGTPGPRSYSRERPPTKSRSPAQMLGKA